jgi:hypothetical protein
MTSNTANNPLHADVQKRRFALLLHAGERARSLFQPVILKIPSSYIHLVVGESNNPSFLKQDNRQVL